jgi:hypothetical protein
MELARREMLSIAGALPADTRIGLINAARPATVVIPGTRDAREVERAVEDMACVDAGTDLAGAMRQAAVLARGMDRVAGVDVMVISDMQGSAWRADAEAMRKSFAELGPGARAVVVPVGAGDEGNLAVTSLRMDPSVVAVRQPFVVDVEVFNGGPEAEQNVVVDVRVNGAPVASGQIPLLESGAVGKVRLLAEAAAPGNGIVEAVVGQGRGRFAGDDTRRSVVRVVEGIRVLLVDGEPGAAFGQGEADYLEAALAPVLENESPAPYVVTRIKATELTPGDIHNKDLIFMCNVPAFRPEVGAQLRMVVERGAGLVVFMGKQVVPGSYATYSTATEGGVEPLLPATVGKGFPAEAPASGGASAEPVYLSAERLDHEWMDFFRPKENRPFLRVPVQQALALGVATNSRGRVVVWYENGIPAVVEKPLGSGRVVMVGTSADPEWNAFFLEPLGPILVNRIAASLLPESAVVRAVEVGARLQLPLPPGERRLDIRLITPDNKVFTVQPELVGERPYLVNDGQGPAGVYRFQIDGMPPREERFVLNIPADESDLRPLATGGLKELFPSGEFSWIQDRGAVSAGQSLRKARVGRELWWPVLLAVFALFIIEIVLARMMTAEAPSSDELPPQARMAQRRGSAGSAAARGRETP